MSLHQRIEYPDFILKVMDYYKEIGLADKISVEYLYDYTWSIYQLKQYVIVGSGFATWAYLSPENEQPFINGEDSLFNPLSLSSGDNLWVIDGKFRLTPDLLKEWHRDYVPRFDRFKCLLLNEGVQEFREVKLV